MRIIKSPYRIDFVENNPKFVLRTQTEQGSKSSTEYIINGLTEGHIYIHTKHINLVWEIVQSNPNENQMKACSNPTEIAKQLEKIKYNYKLREKYIIEVALTMQNEAKIRFETKQCEALNSVVTITSDNTLDIGTKTNVTGAASTLEKIKLKYKFIIEREWPYGSIVSSEKPYEILETPEFYIENSSETVTIGTSVLKPYIEEKNDIPDPEQHIQKIQYNHIGYYLIVQQEKEVEGIGIIEPFEYIDGVIHLDYRDDYFKKPTYNIPSGIKSEAMQMVNGLLKRARFEENKSDWDYDIMGELSEQTDIIIWGQENGMTKRIYQPTDYIYVKNSSDKDIPVTYRAEYTDMNGITGTVIREATLGIGQLYCFQILPSNVVTNLALQNKILKKINVSISSEYEKITRKYIVIPKPYNAKILYLKNRLNLYEPFHITSTAKDMEADGEEITVEETRRYSTTKKEVFTARTGLRNPRELKILEAAIDKKKNYIIEDNKRIAIHILPETIRTMDEKEDMLEVEFKYIKGETL